MDKQFRQVEVKTKALGPPDGAALDLINQYTLRPHTADELYSVRVYLAHDAVDRDGERFPIEVLNDFAATLPGKGFLQNHERDNYGRGRFYAAEVVEEDGKNWLVGSAYLLRASQGPMIADIEGGIAKWVSIGFMADPPEKMKGEAGEYYEYKSPAEALEGSIVWLGAQPDARIKTPNSRKIETPETKGAKGMPQTPEEAVTMLAAKLGLQPSATWEECMAKLDEMMGGEAEAETVQAALDAALAEVKTLKESLEKQPDAKAAADLLAVRKTYASEVVKAHALAKKFPAVMVEPLTALFVADPDNAGKLLEGMKSDLFKVALEGGKEPDKPTDREAFWTKHEKALAKRYPGLVKATFMDADETTATQLMKEMEDGK